jgi:hypothetical protein
MMNALFQGGTLEKTFCGKSGKARRPIFRLDGGSSAALIIQGGDEIAEDFSRCARGDSNPETARPKLPNDVFGLMRAPGNKYTDRATQRLAS